MNLIKIENTISIKGNDLQVVEYKGVRVLSSYDIARLHDKEVKRVNEQFERNKERLEEDVDYFLVDKEEFAVAICDHTVSSKSRHQFERLFTERGYLKLVKSFTDDLSWKVQDMLVDSYFKLQEVNKPKDQCYLEILHADDEIDRLLALRKLEKTVVKPLEAKVEAQAEELAEAAPKVKYYDLVLSCPNTVPIRNIAQDYGWSAQKMNKKLNELGIQYKQGKIWVLTTSYLTQGYARLETIVLNPETPKQAVVQSLKWTQKGRLMIYDTLKSEGILPVCERDDIFGES